MTGDYWVFFKGAMIILKSILFTSHKQQYESLYWLQKVVLCMVITILLGTGQPAIAATKTWKFTGSSMGTTYHVTVLATSPVATRQQIQWGIQHTVDVIDQQMSTYKTDSELSLFNRNQSTNWQPVSAAMFKVLSAAQQVSRWSRGAFDITVGPLVNLWGFGPGTGAGGLPTAAQIKGKLAVVGYQGLRLQATPPAAAKRWPGLQLDLSAIAKGFAVDRVADYLLKLGINNYLVEIGGEIRSQGSKPNERPWQVALEAPLPGERRISRIIPLRNLALATSGDYRNYFEKNGVRYSHTIDPRTGSPIRHKLAAVSVLAENTMLADALATALMVVGPDAGYTLSENRDIAARFLVRTKTGFRARETAAWRLKIR